MPSAKALKIKEQVIKNMIAAHEAAEMQRAKAFPTQGRWSFLDLSVFQVKELITRTSCNRH